MKLIHDGVVPGSRAARRNAEEYLSELIGGGDILLLPGGPETMFLLPEGLESYKEGSISEAFMEAADEKGMGSLDHVLRILTVPGDTDMDLASRYIGMEIGAEFITIIA
jgi:hypothetical protein